MEEDVKWDQAGVIWTTSWDRKKKEFRIRFDKGYWDEGRRKRKVIYYGVEMTEREADRLYLGELIGRIVSTGDVNWRGE